MAIYVVTHCEMCRGLAPANCPACIEIRDEEVHDEIFRTEGEPRDDGEDYRARFNHWRL